MAKRLLTSDCRPAVFIDFGNMADILALFGDGGRSGSFGNPEFGGARGKPLV